jgi:hypothetical protein
MGDVGALRTAWRVQENLAELSYSQFWRLVGEKQVAAVRCAAAVAGAEARRGGRRAGGGLAGSSLRAVGTSLAAPGCWHKAKQPPAWIDSRARPLWPLLQHDTTPHHTTPHHTTPHHTTPHHTTPPPTSHHTTHHTHTPPTHAGTTARTSARFW